MNRQSLALILGFFLSLGTAFAAEDELDDELKAMERAHVETGELKKNFRSALSEAMAKGGPQKALPECKVVAPKLTKGGEKIKVGRASQRLRNPKNAPPDWVKPYLAKFSEAKKQDIPPKTVVKLGKNHYGYLEPIFVEAMCLNCHGKHLGKGLLDAIHVDYPKDQAIGYEMGDFRGLLWLETWK